MALETRTYETILITKVDMPEEGFKALLEKCQNIIKNEGKGEVLMLDDWQKAKISFPINKEPRGQWTYVRYKSLPLGVNELQRNLKINEFVLREFTARTTEEANDYKTLREGLPKELADRDRNRDWKEDRPRRGGFRGGGDRGGPRRDYGDRGPRCDYGDRGPSPQNSDAPAAAPSTDSGDNN
jgi:small subunit ribosomal protein S6